MTKLQAILKKSFSYTLTVIRFSFRYSCKKQELGLDDAYGSLLTWHILWYEKPNSMPSNIFLLLALHNQALSCLRVFIQNYLHKQGLQLVFFYINQDLWLLFSSLKNYKHNCSKKELEWESTSLAIKINTLPVTLEHFQDSKAFTLHLRLPTLFYPDNVNESFWTHMAFWKVTCKV